MNKQKWFRERFLVFWRYCTWQNMHFCHVIYYADTVPALSLITRTWWEHNCWLIVSVEWCTLRRLSLWSDAYRRVVWDIVFWTPEKFGTIDSAVWCTLRRLTPRWDAHCGDWLRGGMHTIEFIKNSNLSAQLKRIRKYLSLFFRGPDGCESWKINRGKKISWHTRLR